MLALRSIGKAYKRYRTPRDRLVERVLPWRGDRHEKIWVLRGIDLVVAAGECVALVGQNGSGKSTLLKLVAGTIEATEGSVERQGRVAAILELGLGFHPSFSGRQNVFLAGQILGLRPHEIADALPRIEAFAEIGSYFDQPVRVYSSGMQVRLAFSVATAIRPEILIVDEALSVGDVYFQHKSFARIKEFRDQGTALLFVSHDASAVKTLCDRALLLDHGQCVQQGLPLDVLEYYNAIIAKREADYRIRQVEGAGQASTRSGDERAVIDTVELMDGTGRSTRAIRTNSPARLAIRFHVNRVLSGVNIGFLIRDRIGVDVFGTNTHYLSTPMPELEPGSQYECVFDFPRVTLGSGSFSVSVALHGGASHLLDNYEWWDRALTFQVLAGDEPVRIGVCNLEMNETLVRRT